MGKLDVYEETPVLATTLGETAGDYFSQTLGLGTLRAAMLLFAILLVAVISQQLKVCG